MVGPKLSLSVVGTKLSLSQNFACHSKFRVCVSKGLTEAWTAYNCPKKMWKNREETVVFILDATKTNAVSEEVARREMATLMGA